MSNKEIDFSEACNKMDKWAVNNPGCQNEYYNILNRTDLNDTDHIDELCEYLEIMINDEGRLNSLIDGEWEYEQFAKYLLDKHVSNK